jgi:hypothetical protein
MPLAGFEPTMPVFKRAKIFHALDRAATVTGVNVCPALIKHSTPHYHICFIHYIFPIHCNKLTVN